MDVIRFSYKGRLLKFSGNEYAGIVLRYEFLNNFLLKTCIEYFSTLSIQLKWRCLNVMSIYT